ncbi:hypothetical protein [Mesorhizobium sp. M2A.F.Ca.ET.043.02.1.1]|uniref:hypothetical protein n=1 Tax=Mesorhizobium sp. M2A.F.Ca.ET.043.02.1.1 TaxID=2493670 RepID=UPI000F758EE1|nr:hypothetical protein [Mesorhizobium sp. M2A.F.Ca.ET.043.02.1.1]AZO04562.1 hypothetical protein EJ068_16955 [Mesorhizobium sp. M2A.F.Ca.ET.043.02.1.1]TIU57135.1 MAG: hypothetical protein E5W35_10340 [Mesorhizobium sp.]
MSVLRSFRQMIGLLSRGDFSRHCDKLLGEAIEALEASPADKCQAKITVTITLDYELGRIDVKADAKSKLPDTVKFMKTPFWSIDGALSVEHPNQIDMFPARKVHDADDEDEERETA